MDLYSVISVFFICLTILIVARWLFTKPITIKHIKDDSNTKLEPVPIPVEMSEAERKKLEEDLNKGASAQRAMDAVIRAANEMMGITPLDDGGTDGKE